VGEKSNVVQCLVWKPEGKRPLGSPARWWEDNIKVNLKDIRRTACSDFVCLMTVVGCCENGDEPTAPVKCEFID
jgi:hypothetical protein